MNGNYFVKLLLKSPLHGLMGDTMLITVTGRRTGQPLTVPVNYYRERESLWILSNRCRNWWRNIGDGARVQLYLHGKEAAGTAALVTDESSVACQIGEYIRHLPMAARALGVRLDHGAINPIDAARIARERLFVRVCLSTSDA